MTVPFKGGAPRKYQPEELISKVIEYFQYMEDENNKLKLMDEKLIPYTITGLCNYLDIVKETWCEYGKKPEYASSVKKAKQIVEQRVEEGLLNGSLSTIGAIFNLKNNFGWTDKIEVTTSQPEQLTQNDIKDKLKEIKQDNK